LEFFLAVSIVFPIVGLPLLFISALLAQQEEERVAQEVEINYEHNQNQQLFQLHPELRHTILPYLPAEDLKQLASASHNFKNDISDNLACQKKLLLAKAKNKLDLSISKTINQAPGDLFPNFLKTISLASYIDSLISINNIEKATKLLDIALEHAPLPQTPYAKDLAFEAIASSFMKINDIDRASTTTDLIQNLSLKDRPLKNIAITLVKTDSIEKANATINLIQDLPTKNHALAQISFCLVNAKNIDAAHATISLISDHYLKADALANIAIALANNNQTEKTNTTLDLALESANLIQDFPPYRNTKAKALATIATVMVKINNDHIDKAASTIDLAIESLNIMQETDNTFSTLVKIAIAQININDIDRAKETFTQAVEAALLIEEDINFLHIPAIIYQFFAMKAMKGTALAEIAFAQANANLTEEAKNTANLIQDTYSDNQQVGLHFQGTTLAKIAKIQAIKSDIDGAKNTLELAMITANLIQIDWSKGDVLVEVINAQMHIAKIANAHIQISDISEAITTANLIQSPHHLANALIAIASFIKLSEEG